MSAQKTCPGLPPYASHYFPLELKKFGLPWKHQIGSGQGSCGLMPPAPGPVGHNQYGMCTIPLNVFINLRHLTKWGIHPQQFAHSPIFFKCILTVGTPWSVPNGTLLTTLTSKAVHTRVQLLKPENNAHFLPPPSAHTSYEGSLPSFFPKKILKIAGICLRE